MFSFLSYTQNIEAISIIAFWILAMLPLTSAVANMYYLFMIIALVILVIDLMFTNSKSFVFEPDYENWKAREDAAAGL